MRIGITGGIGTGKSYVCRLLSKHGIEVYDCDSAAKRLMNCSAVLRQKISALIGTDAYCPDGKLNKAVVARFLLESSDNTAALNAIVHPAVVDDFMNSGVDWLESAILFEAGIDGMMDYVVCVTAPEEVRIARIVSRDGITKEKARQWIGLQWPQEEIVRLSDFEIVNDGHASLSPQIDTLLQSLRTNV